MSNDIINDSSDHHEVSIFQQNRGDIDISGSVDDDDFIEKFIGRYDSKNTRESYRCSIAEFSESLKLAGLTLRDVNYAMVEDYRKYLLKNYKPSSASTRSSAVRSLFTHAMRVGYIKVNPMAAMKPIERQASLIEEKLLTEEQLEAILTAALDKGFEYWLMVYALFSCGARVTEFLELTIDDIKKGRKGYYFVFKSETTKSKKTRRVGIPNDVADAVLSYIEGKKPGHRAFLYSSRQSLSSFLNRLSKSHGVAKCSPHMLRHTMATMALEAGESIEAVAYKLGHASINTTNDFYSHLDKTDAFQTSFKFDPDLIQDDTTEPDSGKSPTDQEIKTSHE